MKLKQLLEQLNQLAKERPEALEMEVELSQNHECLADSDEMSKIAIEFDLWSEKNIIILS